MTHLQLQVFSRSISNLVFEIDILFQDSTYQGIETVVAIKVKSFIQAFIKMTNFKYPD
jgi:hypothetical protein